MTVARKKAKKKVTKKRVGTEKDTKKRVAKKKSKKKPGGPPEQTVEETVSKLLGLQEEHSPYFTADVKKDPSGWLREFRSFLEDTYDELPFMCSFDAEGVYGNAMDRRGIDSLSAKYIQFERRHIKPNVYDFLIESLRDTPKSSELEYLQGMCDNMYTRNTPTLKQIGWFLNDVAAVRTQVQGSSELASALALMKEALTCLVLIFNRGYIWLHEMTAAREADDLSDAESIRDQVSATDGFSKAIKDYRNRTSLKQLVAGFEIAAFFQAGIDEVLPHPLTKLSDFIRNYCMKTAADPATQAQRIHKLVREGAIDFMPQPVNAPKENQTKMYRVDRLKAIWPKLKLSVKYLPDLKA